MTHRAKRPPQSIVRLLAGSVAVGVLLVASAGCSSSNPSTPVTSTTIEQPPQVSVDVLQTRSDQGDDILTLMVANTGKDPFTVTDLMVESGFFVVAPHWTGDTIVPPGLAKALRVPLPEPGCAASAFDATARLTTHVGASTFDVSLAATDSLDAMQRINASRCELARVDAMAALGFSDQLQTEVVDGHPIALLELDITPRHGTGSFTLDTVGSTLLLFQSPDPTRALGVTVTADDAPSALVLRYVPGRCDPHAVAEDKLGTRLPFTVTIAGEAPVDIAMGASPELKARIFSYIGDYCGW